MFSKDWAIAHPSHVIEGMLFKSQILSGFLDIQERTLTDLFNSNSPLVVTGASQAKLGYWPTENSPFFRRSPIASKQVRNQTRCNESWTVD